MPHHHIGDGVKAVNQQPDLIIDGKRHRPQHTLHAFGAQPIFGGFEQRSKNLWIIDSLKKTKLPSCIAVTFLMQLANLCRDTAHWLSIPFSDEQLRRGMLEIGVFLFAQMFKALQKQRCHPFRVVGIN